MEGPASWQASRKLKAKLLAAGRWISMLWAVAFFSAVALLGDMEGAVVNLREPPFSRKGEAALNHMIFVL